MQAEIITIGDELLIGQTIDTNSAWMGKELANRGIQVSRKTAISDTKDAIMNAIKESFNRVDLVLLTGGLGPTKDDITKKTLTEFYGCSYRRDSQVMAHLENIFAKRGRTLLDINSQQADVPEICETLYNEVGTAPGMWFDVNGKVLISMPGVPSEMMHIMENRVFPKLKNRFETPHIIHLTALTIGIPESLLSKQLETFELGLPPHIKLAYLPALNTVKLRLSGTGINEDELQQDMQAQFDGLCGIASKHIFAREDIQPVKFIAQKLIQHKLKVTLAESCTGGYIANQFVQVPSISKVFSGSIISYSNDIKHRELGVDEALFTTVGAVSSECAKAMCEAALEKFSADIAISTTGIAGPGGATPEKPVGLIFIGIATKQGSMVQKFHLFGTREQFMIRASNCAMQMVKEVLLTEFGIK